MTESVQTIVKLGIAIFDYRYDETTQRLYISGPALEEGVWTGLNGVSTFYPRAVIHSGSRLFEGCNLVCEHLGLPIGKVLKVANTELGFDVVEAYITDKANIEAVKNGDKRGFSIEAVIYTDPIRRIAEQIVSVMNISLVGSPACRTCGVTRAYTEQGNVAMSENIEPEAQAPEATIEPTEPITDSVIAVVVNTVLGEEVVVPVEDTAKLGAINDLTQAAEMFKAARSKLDEILLNSPVPAVAVALSAEPEPAQEPIVEPAVEPPAEVVEETPEVVVGVVEETPEVVVGVVEETPEVVEEPVTAIGTISVEPDVIEMKAALSEAAATISTVTEQLIHISSSVQIMEVSLSAAKAEADQYKAQVTALEAELANVKIDERVALAGEVLALDPEIDSVFLDSMSVTQLSAYISNVSRLSKAMLNGAEKKSVKRDEAVVVGLSTPQPTKVDFSNTVERKKFIEQSLNN